MSSDQTTIAVLLRTYLAELVDAGIPDPLAEAFTLSAVITDLYRLAGLPEAWPNDVTVDLATFTAG
jgi:hypothetical protein